MKEQTKIALLTTLLMASLVLNIWILSHLDEFSACEKEAEMRSKQIAYLTDENYYLSSSKAISEPIEKLARCEIKLLVTEEAAKEYYLNRMVN